MHVRSARGPFPGLLRGLPRASPGPPVEGEIFLLATRLSLMDYFLACCLEELIEHLWFVTVAAAHAGQQHRRG